MKLKWSLILSSIIVILLFICFAIYSLFLEPANPKLHKIKIGEEQKLTSVYKNANVKKLFLFKGKIKMRKYIYFVIP